MSDVKLPYITWRAGRPRFNPSAREQTLGFRGEDLRHGKDGPWFTFEQTKEWAAARHAEIIAARAAGPKKARQALADQASRRGGRVGDLLDDWLAALKADTDPDTRLSPDSIASYVKAANAIRWKPESRAARKARVAKERAAETLGLEPPARPAEGFVIRSVAAIDKIALHDFFLYLKKARGHHMAQAAVAAFSAAYTWGGLDRRWRLGANPRHALDLPRPQGRIVIYSAAEIRALIAAADALHRPSIGDAIMLGLFTCQRQRDRLFLKDEGLSDGRRLFRQSKRNRLLVPIRETPQLAERLDAARARVAAIKLKLGTRPETIIVDEATGLNYNQDTYRHVFAEVRAAASAAMPSLRHKRDQDLRDTGITWLARADNTLLEICAISGHSPQSVQTIIKHYLGSQAELADAGIDKLVAWMAREGIAV
jgi:hypothetical protein